MARAGAKRIFEKRRQIQPAKVRARPDSSARARIMLGWCGSRGSAGCRSPPPSEDQKVVPPEKLNRFVTS